MHRDQEPGLRAGEPAAAGLRRLVLDQFDLAIELLCSNDDNVEETVHETRKALKRLRALLRLLRPELGNKLFERENTALRDIGRSLAGARDAHVQVATLDALISRHPKQLGDRTIGKRQARKRKRRRSRERGSKGVRRLRKLLLAERERATEQLLRSAGTRQLALGELRAARDRAVHWPFVDHDHDLASARPGLQRIYRAGKRRKRAAQRTRTTKAVHDWRKRVKDLRYAAELLDSGLDTGLDSSDQRMRGVAKHAKHIGELLGEEHDLALLAARVRSQPRLFAGDRATRKALLRLLERRRKRLRKQAFKHGERLYRRSPTSFVRDLRLRAGDSP